MKQFFTFLFAILFSSIVSAQTPDMMSYQAVVRNNSNSLITNTQVTMQISILQGSMTGTPVYVETQTPNTNENGLVSIQIGNGTLVSGNFSAINWANGPYFIKTETDPDGSNGGIQYTISGTSQLLSVPYALYAKAAGSTASTPAHYVGELYGGGVVAWVDNTGLHGLIVSMVDLSTAQAWSNVTGTAINTTNDWSGGTNTTAITGQSGHTGSAAKLCADYSNTNYGTGVYTDWYLPSVAELNQVWNNFYEIQKALTNDGNTATTPLVRTYYWSSSEYYTYEAWFYSFFYGYSYTYGKYYTLYVRAVRAF
ncbi:MAG: hypothetical protein H6Q25_1244 [Bacteroidetes bacterium]|nr:hypothetical protein [Bacteroidota bacterium]